MKQYDIAELIEENMNKKGINSITPSMVTKGNQDSTIEYIEKHLGKIDVTIGEKVQSGDVAVKVHIIFPKGGKDYYTLVTSGMSDKSMEYSESDKEYKFAELVMKLPSLW